MSIKIISGGQWGDEGKGKFVDLFSQKSDFTVRYNGSGGAAHSVINSYGSFKLHLLPCGVFNKKTISLITNGVVIEPELLLKEIKEVESSGINLKNRLFISPRCHLVFPYHKNIDKLINAQFAKNKESPTTGRGNGPVNADRISYIGIRIIDVLNKDEFKFKLARQVELKNRIIQSLSGEVLDYKEIYERYNSYINLLKPYLADTLTILEKAVTSNKNIIFEGVNGFMLDNDWGMYPYVTTASTLPTEVTRGSGINPYLYKNEVIGIIKAYMTRVDNGECPLPSEWPENEETKRFRDAANEYGSGTGRPRRICWFDTEVVKLANRLSHYNYLCLTRLDTLSGISRLKICIGYTINGKKVSIYDGDAEYYRLLKPIYIEMKGWSDDLSTIKKYSSLPINTRKYIETIEKLLKIPIKYISTGPKREMIIIRN